MTSTLNTATCRYANSPRALTLAALILALALAPASPYTLKTAQELIIQNFVAKAGTAMADVPSAPLHVLRRTVAMTRLAFGPVMSVQAPPNLAPDGAASWSALLAAGINDWGGASLQLVAL